MIFPITVPPTDITRYVPMEQISRYPAFIAEDSTPKIESYRETELNQETKLQATIVPNKSDIGYDYYRENDYSVVINSGDYSEEFLSFQAKSFVRQVLSNLDVWVSEGTDDAIPQIAKTKQLLQQYGKYLTANNESRMMMAGLELVFENNAWENLPPEKVNRLKNIFSRFRDNIEMADIKVFMRELHTQKISVMAKYEETQEDKQV